MMEFLLFLFFIFIFIFVSFFLFIFQVDIWEQRKVFGSRGQGLKDEMLGKNSLPVTVTQVKSSNPIKIVKRDAHSVRIVST